MPVAAAPISVLLQWQFDPSVVAGMLAMLALFRYGVRSARRRGATVAATRVRYFAAAMAVMALALLSPIATLSEERFSVHMVEHLLLLFGTAPLLALSAPVTLALQAASSDVRRRVLLRTLASRPVKMLSHPVLAWVTFATVMYASHFSSLYDAALRHPLLHGLEHLLYLAAAALFWWPVIRRDPVPGSFPWPARLLYLGLAMPYQSLLGLAIYSSRSPLYPTYLEYRDRAAVVDDQQLAGAIMWIVGDVLMLVAIGLAAVGWVRHEGRETERVDAKLDALRAAR
ncbi:MAG: cytochrome c oxidase assembly protein [Mycobacteriales bacterium]